MDWLSLLSQLLLATLFGGMVFFPSVVAPTVFRALDEPSARTFLRALFPRYYAFIVGTSAAAGLALGAGGQLAACVGLVLVAGSTLWVRQGLMPRINAARDASLSGDAAATERFQRGHKLSVRINMVQMLVVLAALVVQALPG